MLELCPSASNASLMPYDAVHLSQEKLRLLLVTVALYILVFYLLTDLTLSQRLAALATGIVMYWAFSQIYMRTRSAKAM